MTLVSEGNCLSRVSQVTVFFFLRLDGVDGWKRGWLLILMGTSNGSVCFAMPLEYKYRYDAPHPLSLSSLSSPSSSFSFSFSSFYSAPLDVFLSPLGTLLGHVNSPLVVPSSFVP